MAWLGQYNMVLQRNEDICQLMSASSERPIVPREIHREYVRRFCESSRLSNSGEFFRAPSTAAAPPLRRDRAPVALQGTGQRTSVYDADGQYFDTEHAAMDRNDQAPDVNDGDGREAEQE